MCVWELNPEAESLCDVGEGSFWLRASMIGEGGPCPLFSYALAFALQLRRNTGNLIRVAGGSRRTPSATSHDAFLPCVLHRAVILRSEVDGGF